MADKLTHFNEAGEAHMVDVGDKAVTDRTAIATGFVTMQPATLDLVREGTAKKGDVIGTARLAGIMAAKKTADLIPLCHPLALSKVTLDFDIQEDGVAIRATVKTSGQTGVEMEALTAVSVAALTLYDMLKAVDRGMVIGPTQLEEKLGGKSGHWVREDA